MDDYFSNTRSNDELTLREAWDNFTKGLISKEQWNETLQGVKRLKENIPAVAETWARGTIAPIFGGSGDINELGDTTRNKLIDMLPDNVGKFAKNLDAAQRLFTPATLTRHLPTTKQVLKSTPRITPEHEGAETMEDVASLVSPGTLALANEVGGLTSKSVNRLGDYAVQKITGNPTATTTDVINYASKFAPNKIFMGENSKLFNKDAITSAERLEASGKDPEEIFKMTGSFRGLDGKWRQEISDAASRLKGNVVGDNVKFKDVFGSSPEPGKSPWIPHKKLGSILEHEQLYEAYPHLKDVKVQLMKPDAPLTSRGSYDPKEGIIRINQNLSPSEARSVILHEIMHDIQAKEKFALGGSHSSYQDQALAVAARDAYNIRQHWNSLPADMPNWEKTATINKFLKEKNINVHPQAWQFATSDAIPDRKLTDMVKLYGLDQNAMPNTPDVMYKNIAGEAEARLVQKRRDMVKEGLDFFYPMKQSDFRPTLDIDPKQALVHGVTPGEIKKGGEVVRRPGDYPEAPDLGIDNVMHSDESKHVPGVKKGEELFVHHNLTADKLLEADRLGGMPVPSLGISKTGQPLDKFGDITLIGGKEMAQPSAKNPVFKSDAYTKRRPGIDYKMDAKSEKAFDSLFDDVKEAIPDYKGYMFNLKDDMSDMQRSYLLKAKYLNEKGLMPKLSDYSHSENYKIYGDMNDIIKKNPGDYEDWVHAFREDLPNKGVNVKERIFKGYAYSGNRRYAEANLENMVKEMKGGAGTENWDYGVGNLRAKATPKFRRFEQIKEERGRINPELFAKVKDEANKTYSDLTDRLSSLGANYSPTDALHEVAVKKNIDLLDRIYPNITPELKADISVFMNKMQHMPTDYFEIKPQRAVGINEFKGAIIPKDSSKRVRETLEKHGIKDIHEYTTEEERKSLISKFGEHMFGAAPIGLGTSEYFDRKQK